MRSAAHFRHCDEVLHTDADMPNLIVKDSLQQPLAGKVAGGPQSLHCGRRYIESPSDPLQTFISICIGRAMRSVLPLLGLAFISTPAFADHSGPSGVVSGGGVTVVDPGTLDAGAAAAAFRLTYARPKQRSDAELAALAGQHIHAHNTDYNLNASAALAYGLTDQLTVSAELPYVRRDNLREGEHSHLNGTSLNDVVKLGDVAGIGDLSIFAKYRVTESESGGFALIAGIKAPTGSTHQHDLAGERLETEHQPGTGSWDPILGASAGGKLGPLQLSMSALYQFSGKGAQNTQLGDQAQGGFALSYRFGLPGGHHEEGGEDHHESGHEHTVTHRNRSLDAFVELTGEWEGRQKVNGVIDGASGGKSVWLTPGARYNLASGFSIAAAVGLPVWQRIRASHSENSYRLTLSLGHAF